MKNNKILPSSSGDPDGIPSISSASILEERMDQLAGIKVLYRWKPSTETQQRNEDWDCAEEYVVTELPISFDGVMIFARYKEKWYANPWNIRPLIAHFVSELAKGEKK